MWVDVEALTTQYLTDELPSRLPEGVSAVIAKNVPEPLPALLVRLMLSGGQRRTLVHRDSLVTLECWAKSGDAAASRLAEIVYSALDDWVLVPDFDGWTAGPYLDPDPDTGVSRYVMTCIVRHRIED